MIVNSISGRLGALVLVVLTVSSAFASDHAALRLERFSLLHGTPPPPVVLAGNATSSPLVGRIEGTLSTRMPPLGSALSPAQIATIRTWINAGADRAGYERNVQPIFAARCTTCHGWLSLGHLRLDRYEDLKKRIQGK
jgi:mono/diheme cytochrome c family protein